MIGIHLYCVGKPHEWDVRVSDDISLGVLERLDMGDEYEYVYTDETGRQHILDVGDLAEAAAEINYLHCGATLH